MHHVNKSFAESKGVVQILVDIDLTVRIRESLAIIGSSGCGKTTLLYILGGLDTPDSGTVQFRGTELSQLDWNAKSRLRNEQIGFVFQFHHLLTEFTALENVALPAMIKGEERRNALRQAYKALERTGLTRQADQPVSTLSGGERQLTSIARAISLGPEVILADEPTGDLDQESGEMVAELLVQLNRDTGKTLIVVTHNQNLARQMGRVLQISSGAIHETT